MMATTRVNPVKIRSGKEFTATQHVTRKGPRQGLVRPQSLPEVAMFLADAAPGTVDAPPAAIIIGAIGVSAAVLLVPFLLRPGIDAAEKMQERDAKSGRWRK